MKTYFFLLLSLTISSAAQGQGQIIAHSNNPDATLVDHHRIESYINYYESEDIEVVDMRIATHEGEHYLLAKSAQGDWVYLIPLRTKKGKIRLREIRQLNACECGEMDMDQFRMENGQFQGCASSNHAVVKRFGLFSIF